MDLQQIAKMILSSDSVEGIAKRSGASSGDVTKVLSQALPLLLGGANDQAKNADTAGGFTQALSSHAKADTSDLGSFLDGIDLADGAKIIGHLLGGDKDSTTKSVAKKAGVSQKKTASILSSVAPLLMSLLGQQTQEADSNDSPIGDLIGSLLEQVDVGELLTGLLTDDSGSKKKKSSSKKKKSSDSSNLLGSLLGSVVKQLLK